MRQDMRVLTSSETNEWYTPAWITDLARQCMGSIDLDPASNAIAQVWIRAGKFFTEGGLHRPWHGNIWLNPPYGKIGNRSGADLWCEKLATEFEEGRVGQGIALVGSVPGYDWYERLWRQRPVCLLRERVAFVRPDGGAGGVSKKGTTLVYFGHNVDRFTRVFTPHGRVLIPNWKVAA